MKENLPTRARWCDEPTHKPLSTPDRQNAYDERIHTNRLRGGPRSWNLVVFRPAKARLISECIVQEHPVAERKATLRQFTRRCAYGTPVR